MNAEPPDPDLFRALLFLLTGARYQAEAEGDDWRGVLAEVLSDVDIAKAAAEEEGQAPPPGPLTLGPADALQYCFRETVRLLLWRVSFGRPENVAWAEVETGSIANLSPAQREELAWAHLVDLLFSEPDVENALAQTPFAKYARSEPGKLATSSAPLRALARSLGWKEPAPLTTANLLEARTRLASAKKAAP